MRDPVLASMVRTAGVTGLELPITLLVSGRTVDGVIVGQAKWLDLHAAALEAPGSPAAAAVANVFREARMAVELDNVAEHAQIELIHMTGVTIRTGETLQAVGMWCVAMEAVEAWKLGSALPQRLRAVEG